MTSCDAGCVLPANSFLPFCVDNLNKESLTLYVQMIKSKVDEEDYWHSSKFKAFTFDDEDDELSRVRLPEPEARVNCSSPACVSLT